MHSISCMMKHRILTWNVLFTVGNNLINMGITHILPGGRGDFAFLMFS